MAKHTNGSRYLETVHHTGVYNSINQAREISAEDLETIASNSFKTLYTGIPKTRCGAIYGDKYIIIVQLH